MDKEWKYYNHALISSLAPHETPHIERISTRRFWQNEWGGFPFFARWTDDFDCGYETQWWYIIKDSKFDISTLKAKRRYEINKGRKYFDVSLISPSDYVEELFRVTEASYKTYPLKYRPHLEKKEFYKDVECWYRFQVYGAFCKENGKLCGYAWIRECGDYVDFCVLKSIPEYEKMAVNAAIITKILEDINDRLSSNYYICDGARNILHETAFQGYLEKYFGFRKAYCRLNIKYRFPFGVAVKLLYPLRNRLPRNKKVLDFIASVLKMEEICRSCEK